MKKLLLLSIAVAFASCTTLQYSATTYSIDYAKYTQLGFFVTESQSVGFEYTPVASVGSKIETGYENNNAGKTNKLTYATADDALAYLVAQSQKLGANAIIGLKLTNTSTNPMLPSFEASGMAVKR